MNVLLLMDEHEFNLLKPITDSFKGMRSFHLPNSISHNNIELDGLLRSLKEKRTYKNKFVINIGSTISTVDVNDIPFFYKNVLIFLIDKEGRKYITSYLSLDQIERELNPNIFYRANRTHIINLQFIDKYVKENDGKICVQLKTPQAKHVRISKGKASSFRKWFKV